MTVSVPPPIPDRAYRDESRPWWVVKSTDRWRGTGVTTVGPFWKPIHVRNLWSWCRLRWSVARGFDR